MRRPLFEHADVKPGQLWKSTHPVLVPTHKVMTLRPGDPGHVTYVMVVHLERHRFGDDYNMNYVKVYFLAEEQKVTSLILMDNKQTQWLEEFYRYCEKP